nr:hypothetical protein [Tanacetum cinerariifolium]
MIIIKDGIDKEEEIISRSSNRKNNKFVLLEELEEDVGSDLDTAQRKEVNYVINQSLQPTTFKMSKWSHNYFKGRWECRYKSYDNGEDEEVMEDTRQNGKSMSLNEIVGEDRIIHPTL